MSKPINSSAPVKKNNRGRRRFSDEQEESVVKMYLHGAMAKDVANHFGMTTRQVVKILFRRRVTRERTPLDGAIIRDLYEKGASLCTLSVKFKRGPKAIGIAILSAGGTIRSKSEVAKTSLKVHGHPQRRVTKEQEDAIIQMHLEGASAETIDRLMGFKCTALGVLERRGVKRAERVRKCRLDESVFDEAEKSEIASYFVGLLMADGCVSHVEDHSPTIILSSVDYPIIERFKDFLKWTGKISRQGNRSSFTGSQSRPVYHLRVSSRRIADALERYGVVPRKSTKEEAMGGMEFNRHFWRGCVDGDGWVSIHRRTNRRSQAYFPVVGLVGSFQLTSQFAAFARTVTSTESLPHRVNSIWGFSLSCRHGYRLLTALYEGSTIAIPRKKKTAEEVLRKCFRFDARNDFPLFSGHVREQPTSDLTLQRVPSTPDCRDGGHGRADRS